MSDKITDRSATNLQSREAIKRPPVERGLTFACFWATISAVVALFFAFVFGAIPWWLNWVFAAPLYYFLVICGHDAMHSCAHKSRTLNNTVGWLTAQIFCVPFPVVQRAHLSHHAKEGAPDDIEQFAYKKGVTLPLRIIFGNLMYYRFLTRCKWPAWGLAAATAVMTAVLFLAWPRETFVGWFLPMQTGVTFIMITTIWIPHGPYSRWWMDNYPFITGFHEDHHAQPAYPFHQISQAKVRAYARSSGRKVLAAGKSNQFSSKSMNRSAGI